MKTTLALLIASLLLPTFGIGQDADLESSKAKAAVREYERKLEDVDKDYQKQLKDLEKSYQMKAELVRARLITNLNAALEEEARKINLEEANKIKGRIEEAKEYEAPTLGGLLGQPEKKPTKTVKAKIPKNAVKFKGHHYLIVREKTTWNHARTYCNSVGGHLARIDTQGEQDFLVQLKTDKEACHIDGTDTLQEGVWVFSDGKRMNNEHIRWYQLPNRSRHGENAVLWEGNKGVKQHYYRERYPFIIEWDK